MGYCLQGDLTHLNERQIPQAKSAFMELYMSNPSAPTEDVGILVTAKIEIPSSEKQLTKAVVTIKKYAHTSLNW